MTVQVWEVRIKYDVNGASSIEIHTGKNNDEVFVGFIEDGVVEPSMYKEVDGHGQIRHAEKIEQFPELDFYEVVEDLGFDTASP